MKKNYIFKGNVRHRRFHPKKHHFSYQTFMSYFDIAHIEKAFEKIKWCSVEKFNWQSFRRKDYFRKDSAPLDESIRKYVKNETGKEITGKIYLLTQLACLGYCFNPISIYIIFHPDTNDIEMLVLEVTNTPWGEQHHYILNNPIRVSQNIYQYSFKKILHVSPFMEMNYTYDLNFKFDNEKIILHMESIRNNEKHFDATLSLSAKEMNEKNMMAALIKHPLMQFKVIAAIYWQALKLWLKRIPLRTHPHKIKD